MKTIRVKEIIEAKPLNDNTLLLIFRGEDGLLYKSQVSCDDEYCVIKQSETNCSRCPYSDNSTLNCKHPDAVIIESKVRFKTFPSLEEVTFPVYYLGKCVTSCSEGQYYV